MPTPKEIGDFVDRVVANRNSHFPPTESVQRRTPEAIAGRFIEEAVELCLATGMNPNDIMGHVMDSIHNQAGKAGRRAGRVIYPSHYTEEVTKENIAEEAADCFLVLKDLVHVADIDVEKAQDEKWAKFTQRSFYVSEHGTLYAVKKAD
jgi:NTP pyrophosphatase (non-canonical NTP hydrolase)